MLRPVSFFSGRAAAPPSHVARLDFVDNHVDRDQGTIRACAILSSDDGVFTPGLFARLRVVGDRTFRAALVDERAIGTDLDRKYVLVVDEQGVTQYRPVELDAASTACGS